MTQEMKRLYERIEKSGDWQEIDELADQINNLAEKEQKMKKVFVEVLCLATYTDVVEVPNDVKDEYLEDYLNEHISELEVNNLEFADDFQDGVHHFEVIG